MGAGGELPKIYERMGMGMIAAASPDGMQAENMQLRAEIEQLREDLMREIALNKKLIADLRKDMDERFAENNADIVKNCKQRITKLEGKKAVDSPTTTEHITKLVKWLEAHEDTRDGLTYYEAADLLNVVPERICQLKDAIAIDKRLKVGKVAKGKRRMVISLA